MEMPFNVFSNGPGILYGVDEVDYSTYHLLGLLTWAYICLMRISPLGFEFELLLHIELKSISMPLLDSRTYARSCFPWKFFCVNLGTLIYRL